MYYPNTYIETSISIRMMKNRFCFLFYYLFYSENISTKSESKKIDLLDLDYFNESIHLISFESI